jgi:hypothetical protein
VEDLDPLEIEAMATIDDATIITALCQKTYSFPFSMSCLCISSSIVTSSGFDGGCSITGGGDKTGCGSPSSSCS